MSNNDTCKLEILQGVAYAPLFLLGLLLNIAILRAMAVNRCSWTDTHVYMLNLAVADVSLVLFLPFRVLDAFLCLSKTPLCTFLISVHYVNMYTSILTSAAISVHRCLAVSFPMRVRSWRWKKGAAAGVCLFIWTLVAGLCVVYSRSNRPEKLWTCYERRKDDALPPDFLAVLVVFGFVVPLLIVAFCSGRTVYVLWKEKDASAERRTIIGIVSANTIVFVFCYTPVHVCFLINYLVEPPADWRSASISAPRYFMVAEWIATTNCCLDSISFYFMLTSFSFSNRQK